jgi:hypothetical protein
MKKSVLLTILIISGAVTMAFSQTAKSKNASQTKAKKPVTAPKLLKTIKYAGSYYSGDLTIKKGSVSFIDIYPETDSTILFYLDLNSGPPSFKVGHLYGRVKIINSIGSLSGKAPGSSKACMLNFTFPANSLIIKTLQGANDCAFVPGVTADGVYKKQSPKIPPFFLGPKGDTNYFNKVSPEKYYKE